MGDTPGSQHSQSTKRPVARHACLACREKKIRCDGEIFPEPGSKTTEITHKRCSNCKFLGIECVFVRSQRGGRRKRTTPNSKTNNEPTEPLQSRTESHIAGNPARDSKPVSDLPISRTPSISNSLVSGTDASASQAYHPALSESGASTSTGLVRPFIDILQTSPRPSVSSGYTTNDHPTFAPSSATSPYYNSGKMSPMLQNENSSQSTSESLQEKVRQLQREAANIQSQLSGNSSYDNNRGPYNSFYSLPLPPPSSLPNGGLPQVPHHPSQMPFPPLPHHHPFGPSFGPSFGPPFGPHFGPPFGFGHHRGRGRHHHHHHHHRRERSRYFEHSPPRSFSHFDDDESEAERRSSRSRERDFAKYHDTERSAELENSFSFRHKPLFSRDESPMSNPALAKLTKSVTSVMISIPDHELEIFDLPNWKTTCLLIDLYYRYNHPCCPFLPPKHRFVYELSVRKHAALLHAMFSVSCRFASSVQIPSPNLRDCQHWYFLVEKYLDFLEFEDSLQALVLLSASLAPGGYIQESFQAYEKITKLIKVSNVMNTLASQVNFEEYAEVATKQQVLRREDILKSVWSVWKLSVVWRINRGFPFKPISDSMLSFPANLNFPVSDIMSHLNLGLFDSLEKYRGGTIKYYSMADMDTEMAKGSIATIDPNVIDDSAQNILAFKLFEDLMNAISTTVLSADEIEGFSARADLLSAIVNKSLYQISHLRRKMLVINISSLLSSMILNVAKIVMNVTQCASLLLIKPHETKSNGSPDDLFNSLYRLSAEEIRAACSSISSTQIQHLVETFTSALDIVRMLEIGEGKVPETQNSTLPITIICGPTNLRTALEVDSLKTSESWWTDAVPEPGKIMSAQALNYDGIPDAWLQYSVSSVIFVANAVTILASSVVLTNYIKIAAHSEVKSFSDVLQNLDFVINDGEKLLSVSLEPYRRNLLLAEYDTNRLLNRIHLCAKFIKTHAQYWPHYRKTSEQVESIISYINDLISRS